ncbi:hypothetical protein H632_c2635p0 [Helicosporidium sp. ATCC 50920]|nr:hypothetical protein H632_c2635p0 [Helicosporidium sp. ATCC 50920]|eukprot:KDD73007.1 hypothetical protein H632_c2635p0 [Helicosporidium sp. ATCC 50920]
MGTGTQFVGRVVSNRMQKSVLVAVNRLMRVPKYNRVIMRTSKFMAHDELNECNVGDTVRIHQTRPLSKNKCWSVTDILHKAKQFDAQAATRGAVARLQETMNTGFAASGL